VLLGILSHARRGLKRKGKNKRASDEKDAHVHSAPSVFAKASERTFESRPHAIIPLVTPEIRLP